MYNNKKIYISFLGYTYLDIFCFYDTHSTIVTNTFLSCNISMATLFYS